jgi:predicted metal-dependent peptidase
VGLVANVLNGLSLRDGLRVMCFDAEPQWTEKIFDPSKIQLRGRGGTDMAQAIVDAVETPKRQDRPELVLVVTDGETDWPSKPVGVPVVVCLTRPCGWYQPPKWMEVVKLYEKARR